MISCHSGSALTVFSVNALFTWGVCRVFLDTYAQCGGDGTSFGYSHIA